MSVVWDAYEATKDADCVSILTEQDEFKSLRNLMVWESQHSDKLHEIGYSIGKPRDS